MNKLAKAYRTVADHIGKILSAAGLALMGFDVTGFGPQIKSYAQEWLGDGWAQKVGIGLFILLLMRTWYTGYKAEQLKQDAAKAAP